MKILIPVDGSDNAVRAVQYVVAQSASLKESPQILLLNVQWNVATGNVKLFINQETINDYYREEGMAALQRAREVLDGAGLAYHYHVSIGTPATAIVQYAEQQGADQIVIGKQGQGGLQGLLLGSVGIKVAQLARVPVMLVA